MGLVRVGSNIFVEANSQHKPDLHKVLPCRHPCHTWDLGLMALWNWPSVKHICTFVS